MFFLFAPLLDIFFILVFPFLFFLLIITPLIAQGKHRERTGRAQGAHRERTGNAQGTHRERTGNAHLTQPDPQNPRTPEPQRFRSLLDSLLSFSC